MSWISCPYLLSYNVSHHFPVEQSAHGYDLIFWKSVEHGISKWDTKGRFSSKKSNSFSPRIICSKPRLLGGVFYSVVSISIIKSTHLVNMWMQSSLKNHLATLVGYLRMGQVTL